MLVDLLTIKPGSTSWIKEDISDKSKAQLALVFSSREMMEAPAWLDQVKKLYPNAAVVSCSTSGEILDDAVYDDSVSVSAIYLERTEMVIKHTDNQSVESSHEAGVSLAGKFDKKNLKHIMVYSPGHRVNGTALIQGMHQVLGDDVKITGGLAGDAARFTKTLVGFNNNIAEGNMVAIGFYGDHITIGHGSQGGWDEFGPNRTITRSQDNILYELDGKNALQLYKEYLGDKADGLPGAALLFPLAISVEGKEGQLVRTILSIDEQAGSMTFAGDIPNGARARFMKANFDNLVDGAAEAAAHAKGQMKAEPELAIMISCVGRKLVLGQRIDEEVEEAKERLGNKTAIIGFYSYGEICPINNNVAELHNQTMTITTFAEV